MDKSLISVIMAIYNEPLEQLQQAIKSILDQTLDDFEFIIILDNPKEHNLKQLIYDYQKKDKRIVFLENKKNIWLAWSLNKWIKIAKWKYIARMDWDDISMTNRLEKQYHYMINHPDVDLLFSWTNHIDQDWKFKKTFTPSRDKVIHIKKWFFRSFLLVHPTLFCKKDILERNAYDNKFMRSQDFELWLRLIWKYKFDIVEDILLDYRVPNIENLTERVNKIKKSTYWTLKALHKNMWTYIFNLNFWMFYIKTWILYLIARTPKKLIKCLVKLKDKNE